ncbi:MAG: ribosome biogenesis GTPase Der [Mycoplasmoidaceae bacterium]
MNRIAIVGKPNVGKSSFFNRIIKKNLSIVDNAPGVTRDRIYGTAMWLTKTFVLIDTGGLRVKDFDFKKAIENQVNYAINEANTILFMVSAKEGINNDDYFILKKLKKIKNKKIVLIVNKAESFINNVNDFYSLGLGKPFFISSSHGIGIGDLLDEIIINDNVITKENNFFKFCIIGRPNVGKSSLVNVILNEERVIVSNIAGTTRDSIDINFKNNKEYFTIIDTAGIKRKGQLKENIDKYSYLRVQKAIKRSQLAILVLDASSDFTEMDEVIGGLIFKANIPSLILVNKWDLVHKGTNTMNEFIKKIKNKFKFLSWSPILFVSALNNERIHKIFEEIKIIRDTLNKKISTKSLNILIQKLQITNNISKYNGGTIKITYATQVKSQIPAFVLFCNNPKFLHFTYARYIENKIRESFGFSNIPILIYYKSKNSRIREDSNKVDGNE